MRYNQWATIHKQEPIHLDAYHDYGIKPKGSWEVLELQVAVDMLRDYEILYYRFIMKAPPAVLNELYAHRYYRRMLEMRYFISTYFTDCDLCLAAREQVSGLYNGENLNELHYTIDRRILLLREWLRDHRGYEDSQEFALELRYYRTFLRATLTACIPSEGTPYLWSRLRRQYEPHPGRHYRPRSNVSSSDVSSSVVSAPPKPSDSVSLSTAGSSQHTTSSARGARTNGLRQTSAEERRRLFLLEQTGLRTNYDSGPIDIPIWPIIFHAFNGDIELPPQEFPWPRMLIDTGAACHIVNESSLLHHIIPIDPVIINGVGGNITARAMGYLGLYGPAFYAKSFKQRLLLSTAVHAGPRRSTSEVPS